MTTFNSIQSALEEHEERALHSALNFLRRDKIILSYTIKDAAPNWRRAGENTMETPFYLDMTAEDRRNYAKFLAGQYVDDYNDDDDNDGSDDEEE